MLNNVIQLSLCQKITNRSLLFAILLTVNSALATNPNSDGWKLLVKNKPFKSQEMFRNNLSNSDIKIVGEAYRGLAFTAKFLGQDDTTMGMLFKSFLSDKDTLMLNAAWINLLSFGRDWIGHTFKDGYKVMKQITKHPSVFNGEQSSMLIDRYVNDGKLSKAQKIVNKMGIVRNFQMIGPFDNISGSGYKKEYPPEKEIDFTRKYTGKDGAETLWFPFYNHKTNGWVFTQYNYTALNAILYYYSNIRSEKDQTVLIGFGASGSFKVFLNDNIVLADSIFRNTGTDMFIQEVRLFKGDNKLLIKIGHENKNSNFLVRFMDKKGKALNSVTYKNSLGTFKNGNTAYKNLTNSPQTEKIETALLKRLEKNPHDLEAEILLMDFYNASELTDKGQKLARKILKDYPQSSLWHSFYSESLLRSQKITESETELKTAFKLCKYNSYAWQNELEILANSAGSRDVMGFIKNSYEQFQNTPEALLYKFAHYVKINNETEAMKVVEQLHNNYYYIDIIVSLITNIYINQGNIKKVEDLVKQFLKWERTSTDIYATLANMYLNKGQKAKAIKIYKESLRYSPNSPGFYYYLAKLSLQHKEYEAARNYINKALAITPTSSVMTSLKGTILKAQGKNEEAIHAFEQSIRYRYNNFDAWEQLLPLKGKPELVSLTKLPVHDSLSTEAKSWEHINGENGTILSFTKDIFLYPSRCSRERHFIMVHLPTQSAIDIWKEYALSYNSYYQDLNITRAFSKSANGTETPADISNNMVVFKTLQPGDDIALEWTIENYYKQEMAKQIWGQHDFSLPYPVFKTELRLVTPVGDTIPYIVCGDSIVTKHHTVDGFRVTTFSRSSYKNPPRESYPLIDPPSEEKVFYSTFDNWADIANWYSNITENKLEQTLELKAVADSILKDVTSPKEKVAKIHQFITGAIRYSYVPFRQSAWIPQPAREVLATKIGDCKDMSSLGKSLLDYVGIESNLVLVNTRDRNSIYPTYIGPNFNHCILSYKLNDTTHYVDMTDNNLSADNLPRMDQGSLALIIKRGNDQLTYLPIDSCSKRSVTRTITSTLDKNGMLIRKVETVKSGVFAGNMRTNYRFSSQKKREKDLQKILVKSFPNITIDTFNLYHLDSLRDTLRYIYKYTAKNAAQLSGNTALLAMNIPDKITGESYPSEESRSYPIDMTHTWFAIGSYSLNGQLTIPKGWRLINKPEEISLSGKWGNYSLSIRQKYNTITYKRKALFNFNEPIEIEESKELRSVLSKITQADNIQLMFYMK